MKRKLPIAIALVTVTGLSAAAMYARRGSEAPQVATDLVSRGSILTVISASGTIEAVDTVHVGTQVSGTILELGADFNSIRARCGSTKPNTCDRFRSASARPTGPLLRS